MTTGGVPAATPVARVSHAIRFRRLSVVRAEALTATMRRIVLGGADLEGFATLAFDDHVKLFFPDSAGTLPTPELVGNGLRFPEGGPRPEARDFTPRRYDATRRELTIDFGLHASGPATEWARAAVPGSTIGAGGPRGSDVLSDEIAWHLLIGDETALPAIARRLEERSTKTRVIAVIEVDEESERQPLADADAEVHWVSRRKHGDDGVDHAVRGVRLPAAPGLAWVAGEAAMARRLRGLLLDERHLPRATVKAAAYWRRDAIGKHEILAD